MLYRSTQCAFRWYRRRGGAGWNLRCGWWVLTWFDPDQRWLDAIDVVSDKER